MKTIYCTTRESSNLSRTPFTGKWKIGVIRVTAILLPLALFAGCQTSPDTESTDDTYSWTSRIEEKVQPVPTIQPGVADPISASSDSGIMNGAWPWGTPRNLTSPIGGQEQVAPVRPSQASAPSGKGIPSSAAATNSPVIVNVNQSSGENADAVSGTTPANTENSRLEELYQGKFDREASRDLEQFGYDFFNDQQGPASSVGPVPRQYVVGPGDEIILSLSGGVEAYYNLTVDRDGQLTIPEFGPVGVAGKNFADLHGHILSFLQQRRHGFDLTVSLGRLRTIRVNVIGRVRNPGVVDISSLGTPMSALLAAGGPNKDGSLRKITLRREGQGNGAEIAVDLYDYLRDRVDPTVMPVLQDGDTLVIPAIGNTVGIAGYVQQPGIYETLSEETSIAEAIDLAGGLTPFSFTPLAHLERTVDGRGRQRIDVELTPEGLSQQMGNGELLLVEAVDDTRQPVVRIEGEVARPGDYEHRVGMRLSELVNRADGLTVDAYLPQVFVSRQLGDPSVIEGIPERTGHLQSRRILVADLGKALKGDTDHDIILMPLDLVTIRSQFKAQVRATVEIIGAVQNPGTYEMTAGMRVSDLIAIAGNPTVDVYYDQAELIRRVLDDNSRQLDVQRFRFNLASALNPANFQSDSANPILSNGDQLVIRALQQSQVRVNIAGRVRFPGEYIFPAGAKITDLIAAAGGLLPDADLRAAAFSRESTRQLQQQRLNHLIERTRRLSGEAFERMVQSGRANEGLAGRISMDNAEDTLARIRQVEADGRIVIPFDSLDFPESGYNLPLENGDRLRIPRYHATVSVAGHVFRPVTLVAGEPITVETALDQSGGLTEQADKDLLYVVRADGTVDSVAQKPARLNRKTKLYAGDVLLVPSQPIERTFGAQLADALILARQIAEVALVGSQIGKDVDMTLVSPFLQDDRAADPAILRD